MQMAYSEVDITPLKPIQLGGFAHRIGYAEEVHSPLYLRLVALGDIYLFTADLLWWDDQLTGKWKDKLAAIGIQALFHASHSHCSPNTNTELSQILGEVDYQYIDYLETQIEACIHALSSFTSTSVRIIGTSVSIGSYRRKKQGNVINMAPNEQQAVNQNVTSFIFEEGDAVQVVFVHFACHPTVSDMNKISSEYCGVVVSEMQKIFKVPVIFLQGFCGDIRPNLVRDGEYYRGEKEDIERIGLQITQAIKESKQLIKESLFLEPCFKETNMDTELIESEGPAVVCQRYEKYHLTFRTSILSLSPQCTFVFANAEMSNFYQDYLNPVYGVGYTDGIVGYIATKKQIDNGGYEGKDFIEVFGNRGTFAPSIEQKIKDVWKGMMK